MSVTKLEKKDKHINVMVDMGEEMQLHSKAKEIKLPTELIDTPILTIIKGDGLPVYYNWLNVGFAELLTDKEAEEIDGEDTK